jgi:hypothetical protein
VSSGWIIFLELSGVIGVVLGLGGWELSRLRREQARDAQRRQEPRSDDVGSR